METKFACRARKRTRAFWVGLTARRHTRRRPRIREFVRASSQFLHSSSTQPKLSKRLCEHSVLFYAFIGGWARDAKRVIYNARGKLKWGWLARNEHRKCSPLDDVWKKVRPRQAQANCKQADNAAPQRSWVPSPPWPLSIWMNVVQARVRV